MFFHIGGVLLSPILIRTLNLDIRLKNNHCNSNMQIQAIKGVDGQDLQYNIFYKPECSHMYKCTSYLNIEIYSQFHVYLCVISIQELDLWRSASISRLCLYNANCIRLTNDVYKKGYKKCHIEQLHGSKLFTTTQCDL